MQASQMLTRTSTIGARAAAPRIRSRSSVVTRADNKVVREFNEEDGKVTVPGAEQTGPLYADEVAAKMTKPKDNLSSEMKEKLKKEYVGLGGAENQAMGNNYFLIIGVVVAVLALLTKLTGAI